MVFSNLEFLLAYLPVTLLVYFVVPMKWRNIWLLAVSLVFYGWGEPVYVFLMIFTIIVDYVCGYFVDKYLDTDKQKSKIIMIAAIVINLAILGFFKYYDFFITNLRLIPGLGGLSLLGLELPIGISFYTFQSLSYVIDVYRKDARVQKNLASFGAYVTLYPQLIAGPIVRYQDVDDQLREREHSVSLFASGVRTFIAGMAKKVLLADVAGKLWTASFMTIPLENRTVLGAWLGIIFYSFQIYFDFSGYSDMAIGLGKMIGFKFLENFDYPYISKSITEFWRRWHMSLGTWFREYVYIPLGGNRVSPWKRYRNIFIVWFLTGFWHGASWNFILWGLYYFVLLVIEKAFLLKLLNKLPSFVGHIYSLFFVLFGWLLFVSSDITVGSGLTYFGNMFGVGTTGFTNSGITFDLVRNLVFIAICVIAATPLPKKLYYYLYEKAPVYRVVFAVGTILLTQLCIAYTVSSDFSPFLYFRF